MDTRPSTPVSEMFQEQKISCKFVSSPSKLSAALKQKYGDINYRVEMRHNVYSIKYPVTERQIDVVRLLNLSPQRLDV
ncbi:hypothetical protein CGRA01v4_02249 [Colletotrichum graminicola]|nr:hypothetical protein CGRA01v4_02249 [Colletotrichum graminicola]